MKDIKLGLPVVDRRLHNERDAIHIPIISCRMSCDMDPNTEVSIIKINDDYVAKPKDDGGIYHGYIDPFCDKAIKGKYYWVCLRPGTVTSLRHVWEVTNEYDSYEEAMNFIIDLCGDNYTDIVAQAEKCLNDDEDHIWLGDRESIMSEMYTYKSEFWRCIGIILDRDISNFCIDDVGFYCGC